MHLWEISSTGQPRRYCSLQGSNGAINAVDFDNEGVRKCLFINDTHIKCVCF